MDQEFAKVKRGGGGLRLKGEKVKKANKHKKSRKREHDEDGQVEEAKKSTGGIMTLVTLEERFKIIWACRRCKEMGGKGFAGH